jgi:3-oxoacyl-(acyl-carrier-protein) synthase
LTAPNGSSQRRLIESVSHAIVDKNGSPSLEAHGTGTALGDPIEVGAAVRALCTELMPVQCTSLKSNLGHLEAAAAAAGLSSLIVGPLLVGVVPINAQLRGLNVHLSSIVASKAFQMPVEVLPCATYT